MVPSERKRSAARPETKVASQPAQAGQEVEFSLPIEEHVGGHTARTNERHVSGEKKGMEGAMPSVSGLFPLMKETSASH